jgi:hypothetical protein
LRVSINPGLDCGTSFGWGESFANGGESPASVEEGGDSLVEVRACEGVKEVGFLLGD